METPLIGGARSRTLSLGLASLGALALVAIVSVSHFSSRRCLLMTVSLATMCLRVRMRLGVICQCPRGADKPCWPGVFAQRVGVG